MRSAAATNASPTIRTRRAAPPWLESDVERAVVPPPGGGEQPPGREQVEGAAERMRRRTIKKLPVTDGAEIVGMVTTADISNCSPSYHPRDETWS